MFKWIIAVLLLFKLVNAQSGFSIDSLIQKSKTTELSFEEYNAIIDLFYKRDDFVNGMVYSNKFLALSKLQNDTTNIIKGYFKKMTGLYYLKKLEDCLKAGNALMPYFRPEDEDDKNTLMLRMGVLYNELNDDRNALKLYKKVNYDVVQRKNQEAIYFTNLAGAYGGLKMMDSSIFYLKKALMFDKKSHNKENISWTYNNIANSYIEQNKPKLALKYLDSINYHSNSENLSLRLNKSIIENYFYTYKALRNVDSALVYLERKKQLNAKIFDEKLSNEIKELKSAYERETYLKQKVEIVDNALEKSKRQKLWYVISLLLLLLISGVILFRLRYQKIKSQHNTLSTEQRLLRSQMTPHFIFNALTVVQGMILNKENKKASGYLSSLSKLMRLILENSQKKLVPLSDEIKAITLYLDLHNGRLKNTVNYKIEIAETVNQNELIPPMIIQPFIENCIEHAFVNNKDNALIEVIINKKDNLLYCTIKDNGVGLNNRFENNAYKSSLSTKITEDRLRLFAKALKTQSNLVLKDRIKTENKSGTIVELIIPFKR